MSIWDKIKKGAGVASTAGKIAGAVGVPYAGSVSVLLEKVINNTNDPNNLEALREIAFRLDYQDAQMAEFLRRIAALGKRSV
jgi:hypothetical protein